MRRFTPLLSLAIIPLLVLPASAAPRPASIPIPVDFQPEGIAVGEGNTFYVGSLWDGDIYRGDLRSGAGALFVDVEGRSSVGMRVDEARDWLVVAGGPTGHAWVYDTADGSTVADLVLDAAGTVLINDVAITRDALYFTNTFAPSDLPGPHACGRFVRRDAADHGDRSCRCCDRRFRAQRHRLDAPRLADRQPHRPGHPRTRRPLHR